jgi:hypothetical protein
LRAGARGSRPLRVCPACVGLVAFSAHPWFTSLISNVDGPLNRSAKQQTIPTVTFTLRLVYRIQSFNQVKFVEILATKILMTFSMDRDGETVAS